MGRREAIWDAESEERLQARCTYGIEPQNAGNCNYYHLARKKLGR